MSALHIGAEAPKAQGFRQTDISVLFSDCWASNDCAPTSHAPGSEGATALAATPATAAAVLSYLAGIGALTLPGIGPLLLAGPLVGALAGLGAAGPMGGLAGALAGLGLPEYEATCYEGRLKEGGILLSVNCDDPEWAGRARTILTQTGAEHVAAAAAEKEASYQS